MHTATYRFTAADLADARGYAYRSLPGVKVFRMLPFLMAGYALLMVARYALQEHWSGVILHTPLFCGGLMLLAWMWLGDRWLLPLFARRQIARDKSLQDELVITWGPEQIAFQNSRGQSQWAWGDFYRWQEAPGGLLLWRSDRLYSYVPKRILTGDQIAELRAMLTGALGAAGKRRK